MSKRILAVAIIATLVLALGATAAFAEGYNSPQEYTRATGYFSGPHGGYTTTTNKCADCHSTHYAAGSFMLLRANSREAACDYCHGGGGGSTVNIMMDNDYVINDGGDFWLDGSAESTTTTGYGTGHTLGYTGNAPADINPAYTSADGFACFDCHSPHGNSARIIATIGNPGRAMGTNNVVVAPGQPGFLGLQKNGNNLVDSAGEWGIDPTHGNFKWFGDPWATNPTARPADDTAGGRLIYRPIWPAGRFLLLKDPHSTAAEGQADTVVTSPANETADNGVNKYMIDWDEPMGPADGGYGGYQDNDSNQPFPFAPVVNGNGGFASLSEFCVDCHDGTAGASTQPANVWQPAGVSGSAAGAYGVVYAHDTQPRH